MKNIIKAFAFFVLIGLGAQSCAVRVSNQRTTSVQRHDNGLHKGWFKSKHKGQKDSGHKWSSPGKSGHDKHKGKHKGKHK